METPFYSKLYPTDRRDYRYNYTTQKLQRIEKRIRQKQINGVTSWAVETEVTAEFDVRHQLWDKMPEYWIQLYDNDQQGNSEWMK
jgi:hypothetical protein